MVVNSKFKIPTALELFKSFKNARAEWKLKTPMQKWCHFYGFGRAAFGFIRMSLMVDVNQVHWFGYYGIFYLCAFPLMSLYTVCYYAFNGDLQMGLPSTCAAAIGMGNIPLMLTMIIHKRFKLQSLIDFGGRYIYHDNRDNTEYNRICSDHMDLTMRRYLIKMMTICFSFVIAAAEPVYAFIVDGIQSTMFEVRIPFTEPKSDAEFFGDWVIQVLLGVHGFIFYFGLESFLSLLESTVRIKPLLIKSELEHTIRQYEKKSITEVELHLKIGNIVKKSNDADNYVDSMSQLFYWRNLFTTTCYTYAIGVGIFCRFTVGFMAGYGLACLSWVQLFYVCEVGEKIQNNEFVEMLYQTKWEVLPVNIQKVIMLLIHRKQNEEGLSMGPFGMGINRETFKVATNKIYSFVMFLRNFFE